MNWGFGRPTRRNWELHCWLSSLAVQLRDSNSWRSCISVYGFCCGLNSNSIGVVVSSVALWNDHSCRLKRGLLGKLLRSQCLELSTRKCLQYSSKYPGPYSVLLPRPPSIPAQFPRATSRKQGQIKSSTESVTRAGQTATSVYALDKTQEEGLYRKIFSVTPAAS